MANRIVLNTVSYHGKGAINEIVPIAQSKRVNRASILKMVIRPMPTSPRSHTTV